MCKLIGPRTRWQVLIYRITGYRTRSHAPPEVIALMARWPRPRDNFTCPVVAADMTRSAPA